MFTDRNLICVGCGREFTFSAEEQAFFKDKNFQHDPKRCMTCRGLRAGARIVRVETRVTCAICGDQTTVPFRPRQGRPVLCRACFQRGTSLPNADLSTTAVEKARDAVCLETTE